MDSREERDASAARCLRMYAEKYDKLHRDIADDFRRGAEALEQRAALSPDERLIEALRDLSFALAMGGGEETDPIKLVARVKEGVDLIQQVEAQRTADLIEELSKTPKTTWGQVKTAVLNRAGLPRTLSTTKADQPTITQKIVERRPFVIEDEADQ